MKLRPRGTKSVWGLPLAFIDVETTGSTTRNGEACDIGVVVVDRQTLAVKKEFYAKLPISNPLGKSEQELNFNGYNAFTFADWKDALPLQETMSKVAEITKGCSPSGWNIALDRDYVEYVFEQAGVEAEIDYHWFDVMSLAHELLQNELRSGVITKFSMEEVSKYLGLQPESLPHTGINGAQCELAVYRELRQRLTKLLGHT